MASVFELLDNIRARPGLYVGEDDSHRMQQLRNLEQLLSGYALAVQHHGIQEPVTDFNREFGEYLLRTQGWSASCGPMAAILDAAASDDQAWRLFWELAASFRASVESSSGPSTP